MKFDIFDMFLVGVSSVFGATVFLSSGGMIGSAIGALTAIAVATIMKRITA